MQKQQSIIYPGIYSDKIAVSSGKLSIGSGDIFYSNQFYDNYINGKLYLGDGTSTIDVSGISISGLLDLGGGENSIYANNLELSRRARLSGGDLEDRILVGTFTSYGQVELGLGTDILIAMVAFENRGTLDFGGGSDTLAVEYYSTSYNYGTITMGGEGENDADTITVAQFELAVPTGRLLDNSSSGATSNGLVNYSTIFTGGGNDFVSGVLNYGSISTGAGNDRVFARNFSTINLGDGDDLVGGFVDAITGNSLWDGGYGTDTIALGDGTYVVTQGASGLSIGGASFVDFEYICGIGQIDFSLLSNGALPDNGSVPYPTTQSLLPGTYTISNAGTEIAFALG